MFNELQKIIAPNTLSSFEFTKLEELLKTYSEEDILNAYKNFGYKPIAYITKVLSNNTSKKGIAPDWLKKEIVNQPIDKETMEEFEDFNKFLADFREN